MRQLTRRKVLAGLGAAGAVAALPRLLRAQPANKRFTVKVDPSSMVAMVPPTYTGLSYESAQLTHADFFAAGNKELIALFRTLGSHGVLRIGGNTSAFTTFAQNGAAEQNNGGYGPDKGSRASKQVPGMYKITPHAIDNLNAFLEKTEWKLLYGLNLRHGTPDEAAKEAAYVMKTCGGKVLALQFGNEPDLFKHDNGTPWGYEDYIQKWQAMYKVVHAKAPDAVFAGPDSAFNASWVKRFAADTKGQVSLLSTHYYAEGPPTDPKMTIEYLLRPGEKLKKDVYDAMDAAKAAGLPFRMSEGNSCYQGGKPGVSNTLASALWAGDFMLDLAARGSTGVNLHGGGEGAYTPIATDKQGHSSARPDFSGMWLAGQFAGAEMVKVDLQPGNGLDLKKANLTAYAAKDKSGVLVAVFNKGDETLELTLNGVQGGAKAEIFALTGPSLSAESDVHFGEGSRNAGKAWTLKNNGRLQGGSMSLPAASAVLLRAK